MTAPTIGSLFAGIGGFDLGFERAGFKTAWQVEINPINQAVLAEHFPHAKQFGDITKLGVDELEHVDCITAGFPCQDISIMGAAKKGGRQGLAGKRSGLFYEVIRIADALRPEWVVLENVAGLLFSNDCRDLETVINALAQCGYVGCWRVLNARYFGVPQARRRVFIIANRGRYPLLEFLADAAPVDSLPIALAAGEELRDPMGAAANTLTAANASCRISLGCEPLLCHRGGRGAMVERGRVSQAHGLPMGLDDFHYATRHAAGNAVVPQVSQWIAEKIISNYG